MIKNKTVKIGVVGVDSGQLMIFDPLYIESQFKNFDSEEFHSSHPIYKHKHDGKLWQFCYMKESNIEGVNAFPETYSEVIPEYKMSPNDLIEKGLFEESKIDPIPHIPEGEFSCRGINKMTTSKNMAGQLNYLKGHEGVAVAFRSGLGDGTYDVFAEIVDLGRLGERVKKVWVELITDEEVDELKKM